MSTLENIQVKNDYVLVTLIPEEKMSAGGILLTKTVTKTKRAVVVSVGPGYYTSQGKFIPTTLLPNDEVIFPTSLQGQTGTGINLTSDDKTYHCFFIRERDVLAVDRMNVNVNVIATGIGINNEISIIEQHEKHEG